MQSQHSWRWGGFSLGPRAQAGLTDSTGGAVNFARCGCFLTLLSAAAGRTVATAPWYPSPQIDPHSGQVTYSTTFGPTYLDAYFNTGPNPDHPKPDGWAYLPGSGGTHCGTNVLPFAAEHLGQTPSENVFTTGLALKRRTWTATTRHLIDQALEDGLPTIVLRKAFTGDLSTCTPTGSLHAILIMGWNGADDPDVATDERAKYLVYDPMWIPAHDASDAKVAGTSMCGRNTVQRYSNFVESIEAVFLLDRVVTAHDYMLVKDDPEPIELRITDPRGRRTGHDPSTGENLAEDDDAFYEEARSFTDPLLLLDDAPVYRYLSLRDPEPGVYGLEVFGTGDGPYTLTLATSHGAGEDDAATVTGDIATGGIARYEITRSGSGSVSIEAVDAFGPRARAGNDAYAFMGGPVTFDGRGSYQVNGKITGYDWDFGDGTSANGGQQTHVYPLAGTYTATVTVSNPEGLSSLDARTVLVVDPSSLPEMETVRVSTSSVGSEGNGQSPFPPRVTPDGHFVVFVSLSDNLVAGDTNLSSDVFVKNMVDGTIERVSVASGGGQAISPLGFALNQDTPSISDDGRFVSFVSDAPNLYLGDIELTRDIFVHDRLLGTTELAVPYLGTLAGSSFFSVLSADARYLAFDTVTSLVPDDTNGQLDVYLLDRQTMTYEQVSLTDGEGQGNGASGFAIASGSISADGTVVAFGSSATNLDSTHASAGLFFRDRIAGTTGLVSLTSAGTSFVALGPLSMSADGRTFAFVSEDNGLAASDNNAGNGSSTHDVFVRDRTLSKLEHASVSSTDEGGVRFSGHPMISPDGRFVAFVSASENLAPGGTATVQAYLRDRQTQTTVQVTLDDSDAPATNPGVTLNNSVSEALSVTLDGGVAFPSLASNLVAGDFNGKNDVFFRRRIPSSINGSLPIANVGGPYLGWASSDDVPAGVRLDASASADPSGRPLIAHWDFGDGTPIVDGALAIVHAYSHAGVYPVSVTVSADADVSKVIVTSVEIMPSLAPDVLSVSACGPPGGALTVSGSAVTSNAAYVAQGWDTSTGKMPVDPVIVTMPWGDVELPVVLPGLTFESPTAVPAELANGVYSASTTDSPEVVFEVPCGVRDNDPPRANAGGPIYRATAGVPIVLDGSRSTDGESSSLTYTWDFGDDTTGMGKNPEHAYAFEGTYMVSLVVNDGAEDSALMVGTHSFAMVQVEAAGLVHSSKDDGCNCSVTDGERPGGCAFGLAMVVAASVVRRRGSTRSRRGAS